MASLPLPLLLPFGLATAVSGQSLLVDANPDPPTVPASSYPSRWASDGRTAFFSALSGFEFELWKTDGTRTGTTLAVDLGPGSSSPQEITFIRDGVAILQAFTQLPPGATVPRTELWRTDGTPNGTWSLELAGGNPVAIDTVAGLGYVLARSPAGGDLELWCTDGSVQGTRSLQQAFANPLVYPAETQLYIFDGGDLWRTDGTLPGTYRVLSQLAVRSPVAVGDDLFFKGRNGRLFKTNGAPGDQTLLAVSAEELVASGDLCYFTRSPSVSRSELWVTDGSRAGTRRFVDLGPRGVISGMGTLAGELVFAIFAMQTRIVVTDSAAGTLTELAVASLNSSARPVVANDKLYFFVGFTPWVTDGTAAGTRPLAPPSSATSFNPTDLVAVGDRALLSANDTSVGTEPWVSDGTAAGTRLLRDLAPTPPNASEGSYPTPLGNLGDAAFFSTLKPVAKLWRTDGTPSGTRELIDLAAGVQSPPLGTFAEDWFLFDHGGRTPWTSDGTAAGTRPLFTTPPTPGWEFVPVPGAALPGNLIVFMASTPANGREPWISDGSAGGTREIRELYPGPSGGVEVFYAHDDRVWMVARGRNFLQSLFVTDGSANGTLRLYDFPRLPGSGQVAFEGVGNRVVLLRTGLSAADLWTSDGTGTGTEPLSIFQSPNEVSNHSLAAAGDHVIVGSVDGDNTYFYATDGTTAGSRRIATFSGPAYAIGAIGGSATLVQNKDDLWRVDVDTGQSSFVASMRVLTIPSGSMRVFQGTNVGGAGTLLFPSNRRLWKTDGTTTGTTPVPAPNLAFGFAPRPFRVGPHFVFVADDGIHGDELHRVPVSALDDYVAQVYGAGCPRNTVAPTIGLRGEPLASSGAPFEILLDNAPPNALALLGASANRGRTILAGCTVLLGGLPTLRTTLTDGEGFASVSVPTNPSLVDQKVDFQYGLIVGSGLALTRGLEIVVGP